MGQIITSEIRPTHRSRGSVEAWRYDGQSQDAWPDWVRSHFVNREIEITKSRIGSYAVRDDDGYFWKFMKADLFHQFYESISTSGAAMKHVNTTLVNDVAKLIAPEWFNGVSNGSHPLDNYPEQHLAYQQRARDKAIKIIDLVQERTR